MKKLFLLCTAMLFITSCAKVSNIKTIKDDPDIPAVITQLAEAKRDLLQKDTLNTVLNESFRDVEYEYDYKITKDKVEFQRAISMINDSATAMLIMFLFGLAIGFILTGIMVIT